MPYKHCQKIMNDGHRCNKQFYIRTNFSPLKFCPEHDTGVKRNKRAADARIEAKSKFVEKMMDSYDDKIAEYDSKFDSVRTVLMRMDTRIKLLEEALRINYINRMAGEEE